MEFVRTNHPSDLTDSQWEQIKEFFPQGPNTVQHKRSLINAVLYQCHVFLASGEKDILVSTVYLLDKSMGLDTVGFSAILCA